jgi:hypothetical protein
MESLETDIEMAPQDEDREDSSEDREDREQLTIEDRVDDEDEDDRHPLDRVEVEGNTGHVELDSEEDDWPDEDGVVTVGGTQYRINAKRQRRTLGEDAGEAEDGDGGLQMGETVKAGEYEWQRIQGITDDERIEPHFNTTFKTNLFNEKMLEVDIFRAFMPLDTDGLLHIIRENANEDEDKKEFGWDGMWTQR